MVTPAARRALLETASVRARLNLDSSKDALLTLLIADATGALEHHLGRTLARQRYAETLRSDGQLILELGAMPIEPATLTVSRDDEALTGVFVEDRRAGHIGMGQDVGFGGLGWGSTAGVTGLFADYPVPGSGLKEYSASYWAGYLLPGQVLTWGDWPPGEGEDPPPYSVTAGDWVRGTGSALRFQATVGGEPSGTEPTWSSLSPGDTVVDGAVTWLATEALELPSHLERACWSAVRYLYFDEGTNQNPTIREMARGDKRIAFQYGSRPAPTSLPDEVLALVAGEPRGGGVW